MENRMLTLNEFADKLNVSRSTVKRMIKNGVISFLRTGLGDKCHYRIPESEIQRMAVVQMEKFKLKEEKT